MIFASRKLQFPAGSGVRPGRVCLFRGAAFRSCPETSALRPVTVRAPRRKRFMCRIKYLWMKFRSAERSGQGFPFGLSRGRAGGVATDGGTAPEAGLGLPSLVSRRLIPRIADNDP